MKLNKTWIFTGISSIALCIVLIIQVIWILQTARIKEELFNEKANLVLTKTTEALLSDSTSSNDLGVYVDEPTTQQADSVLKYYMNLYEVNVEYTFNLVKNKPVPRYFFPNTTPSNQVQSSNQACISEVPSNDKGFELKLHFPGKRKYIMSEISIPFISSIILITVVIILFWRTILTLQKEKRISEHTTEFLNNMTHEFKTPLTNIALAGKMITKEPNKDDKEKVTYYSGIILEENEKLRLQVEQVLSMTALERGELPLQKTKIDIHQLIKDAARHMSIQLENLNGKMNLSLTASKFEIQADRAHLMNALYNLIDNAIKYADKDPEIDIKTYDDDHHHLVIEIKDNGPGIDKIFQEKVFDKYFRIPKGNVHDVKGFGLGLAYVKQIVQLHGGTIIIQSEAGKGCLFIIQLPNG